MSRKQVSELRRVRVHRPSQRPASPHSTASPEARRTEVLGAREQDLRNYLRSPYDPFYSAQAGRYFTRGILHSATVDGFPRLGAIAVTCCTAVGCAIGAILTIHTVIVRDGLWGVSLIWGTFFTILFGALAFALLSRLRGQNQRA